jgi:NADPH:quinone reductase-like Zn-dependent oxidoreductase
MTSEPTMTQIVFDKPGGPEQLTVQQEPMPVPGPAQVLVRVEAAGVAFNDITTRQGRSPGRLPRVLGFDMVGEVVALGEQVTSVSVGQRVAALLGTGGYSAYVALDAGRVIGVRSDVDAAEVDALVLNYVTAWQLLHRVAKVAAGQSILVIGAAGGVGSALLELAKLDGITVYGTSSPARREIVEAAGGHWLADTADASTEVDAVFDPVGGPSLRDSRRATRAGGVAVSFGFSFTVAAGHSKYVGLARTAWALVRARLTPGPGVRLYRIEDSYRKHPDNYREDLNRLVELLADGLIKPVVTRLPLTEAAEAHRRLEAREVAGKLVLIPGAAA